MTMTNNEIQDTIDYHSELISLMALIAYRKLRQPTYWSVEDLIQEARCACIMAIKDYDPNKGTTLKSYIYTCTLRKLTNTVRSTWRIKNDPIKYLIAMRDKVTLTHTAIEDVIVEDLIKSFTNKEREYVQASVGGLSRRQIKDNMDLTQCQEEKLRKRVIQKILN